MMTLLGEFYDYKVPTSTELYRMSITQNAAFSDQKFLPDVSSRDLYFYPDDG